MPAIKETKDGSVTVVCDCGEVIELSYNKDTSEITTKVISETPKKESKEKKESSFFDLLNEKK